MKERILHLRARWKSDYQFKTFFASGWSLLIEIAFALFNALLGVIYNSVWNGSVSVYYLLLAVIRGIIQVYRSNPGKSRKVCLRTHKIMLFADLCLIAPIAFTVMGERSYKFGLIPAIAMAAYTACRVSMGAFQYLSSRKHGNLLVKELRVINLQAALVSVLTLQNALIIATGSSAKSMIALTGWTSAAIWLMIVFFTVRSFRASSQFAR